MRHFIKRDADGNESLRIEIDGDASRHDVERAIREIEYWYQAQLDKRDNWLEGVNSRLGFELRVRELYQSGWMPTRIADYVNREIVRLIRECVRLDKRRRPGQYSIPETVKIINQWLAQSRLLQRADKILACAVPGKSSRERYEVIREVQRELRSGEDFTSLELRSALVTERAIRYCLHKNTT